nr:P-loop NTPase fold protein [Stackebrandtia nassauensis]
MLQDENIGDFDSVQLLTNATKYETEQAIEQLFSSIQPDDLALVYFVGLGVRAQGGQLYLASADTRASKLATEAISSTYLRQTFAMYPSRVVLLLDCSHSGTFIDGSGSQLPDFEVEPESDLVVLASTTAKQQIAQTGLPAFTEAVRKGLASGEADIRRTGSISASDLWHYVVAELKTTAPQQTPTMSSNILDDLLIAKSPAPPNYDNQQQVPPPPPSWTATSQPSPPPPREHVDWVDDAPAETDLLHRQALAQVLATRLARASASPTHPAFLIHVDGPWGSGKSTLLKLLETELSADHLVVNFNAWRNARVQPPWWSLLTTIRDRVINDRSWVRRVWSATRETLARARRSGAPYFLAMAITAALMLTLYLTITPAWTTTALKATATTVTSVAAAIGVLWAVSKIASRRLLWNSARGAQQLEQSHTDPMGEVSDHFGWLIRHSRRPVVVFIDDLDRCDGPIVVEILEAIQTLARDQPAPGCAASFVIAADGAWLRRSYEDHYSTFEGAVDQPGQPLGYLFQEKLFQLSVPVPSISGSARANYLTTLLGGRPEDAPQLQETQAATSKRIEDSASEAEVLDALKGSPQQVRQNLAPQAAMKLAQPEVEAVTEHSLEKFAPLVQANPRGVKRFLNTYSILRTLRTLEGNIVPTDTLATWALLRSRWPQLADHLEHRPQDIGLVRGGPVRDLPRPLRSTATSAELQAFLRTGDVELTEAEIRACCGGSVAEISGDSPQ